jgi:hypothetical protein
MLTAIPLTIVPLVLFNVLGYALGGAPWNNVLFTVPHVGPDLEHHDQ